MFRERIYNVEKGKSSKQDEVQIINQMFGAGCIISYNSGNNGVYGWENGKRKGKSRSSVIRNYLNKQLRARNDRTSQETPINEITPISEASSKDGVFFDGEKTKFSLSDDSEGRALSEEQKEYFSNSKIVDINGSLKVMYHGTSNGKFTVFDTYGSKYGLFGQGSYFTDNKSVAESYTNKGKGDNKQVYESYLNITNPIDMDAEADVSALAKALPDADFSNCTTNEDCYRAMESK